MQYRRFPKIPDLEVSTLGFGCMRLPTLGGDPAKIDIAAAQPLLRGAIDAGVNYVDTAYPYHGGQSERFVGLALADGYRARVQLATKLPIWLVKGEADWERLLDEQLARLQTDHIDFYMMHALNAERVATLEAHRGLAAMERAKRDGRIRHLGFSFHDSASLFTKLIDSYDWEFCQIQYNFLDTEFQAGTAGLRLATARKVGVIVMEPLRGGGLVNNLPPEVERAWARAPFERTPAEWALRWVWNHPEVVTVLSGMNREAQLEENLRVADLSRANAMSAVELASVLEVARLYRDKTKVGCTTCGYCTPCTSGVCIPDIFNLYNASALFQTKAHNAAWYRQMFVKAGGGADQCNECGDCEPKCPQSIAIIEKLKEAHAHLTSP